MRGLKNYSQEELLLLLEELQQENEDLRRVNTEKEQIAQYLTERIEMLSKSDLELRKAEELQKLNQEWKEKLEAREVQVYERTQAVESKEKELMVQEQKFEERVQKDVEEKTDKLKRMVKIEQENWRSKKDKEFSKKTAILYVKTGVPFIFLGVIVLLLAGICIVNVYPDRILEVTVGLSEIGNGIVALLSLLPMLHSWLCSFFSSKFPWDFIFALLVYVGIPVVIFFLCRRFIPERKKIDFKDKIHRYKWSVSFASLAVLPFFLSLYLSDNIGLMSWLTWYLILTLPLLSTFYYKTRTEEA